ncbi:MAG: hypothetical protein K2I93_03285, partial [Oscillospiraceae bacterium]|nr:hypothetical protein [Oscillospiraceae bacterium]
NYFNGIDGLNGCGWHVTSMACTGTVTTDGTYTGTYPTTTTTDNATGTGAITVNANGLTYAMS